MAATARAIEEMRASMSSPLPINISSIPTTTATSKTILPIRLPSLSSLICIGVWTSCWEETRWAIFPISVAIPVPITIPVPFPAETIVPEKTMFV